MESSIPLLALVLLAPVKVHFLTSLRKRVEQVFRIAIVCAFVAGAELGALLLLNDQEAATVMVAVAMSWVLALLIYSSPSTGPKSALARADVFAFIPLLVFLGVVRYHHIEFPTRWAYAYVYTFLPAFVFSVIAVLSFTTASKLWLGTNIWFAMLGFLALIKAWGPLEVLGTSFQESGGFVATALIGAVSTLFARGGFIGQSQAPTWLIRRCSWWLVAAATASALLSFVAQGHRLWSIMLPVLLFMSASVILRRRLRHHCPASPPLGHPDAHSPLAHAHRHDG